jgi:hypothetical protein
MPHKRRKLTHKPTDDGSPAPASEVSSAPAPEDPPPPATEDPPPELNSAEEADDEDEPLGDEEPLNEQELAAYMEGIRTIEEQEAELDHLRYIAARQRRWIDSLVGEFTACGHKSSHLLT